MTWWEAVILGVVQGFTEFFPVSSDGHLVMTKALLGLTTPGIAFDVALHVATLLSVLIVYRERIIDLARRAFGRRDDSSWPYLLKVALATLPAVIAALTLMDWFEARFQDAVFAGTMIMVTGSFVWSSRWARSSVRNPLDVLPIVLAAGVSLIAGTLLPFLAVLGTEAAIMAAARLTGPRAWSATPSWRVAFLMGIAQAVAILPGVTRSGGTVVTALWGRVEPVAAAEFSFMMAIPAILGAAVLTLPDLARGQSGVTGVPLFAGALAAAVTGIFAIRFFVALLRRQNFHVFAYYCWIVGALFVLTRQAEL